MNTNQDRFKLIASVYLILVKSNRILLLKRQNTGYQDGKYGLPAGHLEDNETLTGGLYREISEEIGINLDKKSVKLVHVMHRREADIRIDFFYTIGKYKGKPVNNEPEKCQEIKWFPISKLPKNIIPYIKQAIQNYQKNIFYYEIGWTR